MNIKTMRDSKWQRTLLEDCRPKKKSELKDEDRKKRQIVEVKGKGRNVERERKREKKSFHSVYIRVFGVSAT
jgi:hypothetical protein